MAGAASRFRFRRPLTEKVRPERPGHCTRWGRIAQDPFPEGLGSGAWSPSPHGERTRPLGQAFRAWPCFAESPHSLSSPRVHQAPRGCQPR